MDVFPRNDDKMVKTETVVRLENVEMRYPGQDRPALTIPALDVNAGERVALIGRAAAARRRCFGFLTAHFCPRPATLIF